METGVQFHPTIFDNFNLSNHSPFFFIFPAEMFQIFATRLSPGETAAAHLLMTLLLICIYPRHHYWDFFSRDKSNL